MITPTVGRVVWFYLAAGNDAGHLPDTFTCPPDGEPLAAIVARVLDNQSINLTVLDADGVPHPFTEILLLQEGDPAPGHCDFAAWMPYQIDQAKRAADRERDAKQLAVAADSAADARRLRGGTLDLALRTPGLASYQDVLDAAKAYQAHIDGQGTTAASQQPAPGAAKPGYSSLPPHQQRVVDEQAELDGKLAKLHAFFDTTVFAGLDPDEQERMREQAVIMQDYSDILDARIAAFGMST